MKAFKMSLLGVVAVGAWLVIAAEFGLLVPHERVAVVNAERDDGTQPEGLQTNETIHQIWDAGLNPFDDDSRIVWLDNSTLVFMADKNPKPASRKEAPNRTPWLYIWRLGEKPQPHGEDPQEASRFYRAARGQICFQQRKRDPDTGKETSILMLGAPGEEREAPLWNAGVDGRPLNGLSGYIETIDCQDYADPAMTGRVYATDSFRCYYIDRTSSALPPAVGENPVLMKSDGSGRKILPIPPEEVGSFYFRTFENVFWSLETPYGRGPRVRGGPLVDDFQKWKTTNCIAVWRIEPESGAVERRCIPFGPWSGREVDAAPGAPARITLVPTAKGLFFSSTHFTDSPDSSRVGASGLYRLENGAADRVLAGYIGSPTVSPNGCRVAFIYGPNWVSHEYGTPGSWTVAAIDLCASG